MARPLSNILVKVFARGFYKVNSGLLLFLFVAVLSYCFFINTAGDVKLMKPGEAIFYNFILLLTFISDPLMTGIFFIAWLLYTIKSWSYVSGQLLVAHHQFIYYSTLSNSKLKQFKAWFYTQFIISLPFVFYVLIAGITGLWLKHYVIIAAIVLFTVIMTGLSALLYVGMVNKLINAKSNSWLFSLSRRWRKPFYSLFIYHVADRLKLAYLISKGLSYLVIITMMFSLADVKQDIRVACVTVLGIALAHSILIYQQHRFDLTFMGLARNLPFGIAKLYLNYVLSYLLLLLPEAIWLFISFSFINALGLLLLTLGIILLFHCLLYKLGMAMNKYLLMLFTLFISLFCVVLFGLIWVFLPLCIMFSFTVFYNNYYKAELKPGIN